MKYFALTLNMAGIQPKPKSRNYEINKLTTPMKNINFSTWIFGALFIVGIFYLISVNTLATKGYEIERLEKQVLELRESNRRPEIETTALKSIETIEAGARSLNLVPSNGVNYFQDQDFA